MVWLLVCWCLLSVPLGVVVGRCIAAADRQLAAAPGGPRLDAQVPQQRQADLARVGACPSLPASQDTSADWPAGR